MTAKLIEPLSRAETLVDVLRSLRGMVANRKCVTISTNGVETPFTYDDILVRAEEVANLLLMRTKLGDRVLIVMPTTPSFIDAFFGCILAGRIAVPLPVEKSRSRYSRVKGVISDCSPTLALFASRADFEAMQESLGPLPCVVLEEGLGTVPGKNGIYPKISARNVAFIQYTSGSTGDPKGVVLTHGNLVENIRMIQQAMRITPDERVVSWLPIHHDMGLVGMLLSFVCTGSHTRIYPYQEFARNPLSWIDALVKAEATLTGAPNFAFELVGRIWEKSRSLEANLSSVRLIYCGSERISPKLIHRFYSLLADTGLKASTFFPCYGLAEAALFVSGSFKDATQLMEAGAYPSCGRIAAGLSTQIVDDIGEKVVPGEKGEVRISGPSVSPGYWKEIGSEVRDGSFWGRAASWLSTGDLAFESDGELHITGRLKDVIKLRGRNVHPEDVELAVETLEQWFPTNGVVAISEIEDEQARRGITLVAEIHQGMENADFGLLLTSVQSLLSFQDLRCERLVVLPARGLPKTSSGKKRRGWTAQLLEAGKLSSIWDSRASGKPVTTASPDLVGLRESLDSVNLLLADERRSFPADFIARLRGHHLLALLIPKEHGGTGLTHADFAHVGQQLGEIDLTVGALIGNHNTIGVLPIVHATHLPDKAEVLRSIACEGLVAAFAVTEPGAGSNPRMISSTITREGGRLFLSGEKIWIGNAGLASFVAVFAKEVDESGNDIGISAFLLRRNRHRYRVGEEQLTLGLKAMPQNRLFFERVELAETDRLSAPGQGLALAFQTMEYARFGLAAMAIGAMKFARAHVTGFASNRQIWTGLLSENFYFRTKMAEIDLRIRALEKIVERSADCLDRQNRLPQILSLACKVLAGEWLWETVDTCVQFSGGRGYTENFNLARTLRDSRVIRIFEGPTESIAYQLGAICARQSPHSEEIFSSILRKLFQTIQEQSNSAIPTETFNVATGLYAAEFLAWSLLMESDGGVEKSSRLLLDCARNRWLDGLRRCTLVSSSPARRPMEAQVPKGSSTSSSLFETWNGYVTAPQAPSEVKASVVQEEEPRPINSERVKDTSRMDNSERAILTSLSDWLKTQTRARTIDSSRSLSDYGVDSLMAYELMCFVEERFNVHLSESVVMQRPSLDQLVEIILEQKSSPCGRAA